MRLSGELLSSRWRNLKTNSYHLIKSITGDGRPSRRGACDRLKGPRVTRPGGIWTSPLRCALSGKAQPRKVPMTMLRMLPAILAAAFAFAAGPAAAEMKSQWVEYSHGDTKLKAYMV